MYLSSETSKYILNCIVNNNKIDFKNKDVSKYKKEIQKLKIDYNNFPKTKSLSSYKYYIFWELIKKKYDIQNLKLKKRNQKKNSNKVNIEFSIFGKILGYNPSLLSMLIFEKQFKVLVNNHTFFEEIEKVCELETIKPKTKLSIIDAMSKKELQIITPLCPDYEHVSLGMGLYKYTFNKLNDGVGLIGKRLSKILNDFHKILEKYDVKYKHFLYYGDFEAYSKEIQKRLKISEKEFIKKLENSAKNMKKKINGKAEVKLLVKELSKKNIWKKKCYENFFIINKKFNNDIKFKVLINEIASSRTELYSSWFPDLKGKEFSKLSMMQGSEYTTMGDIFKKKFKNPIVLGLDHPKMADFYSLNVNIPVIYGRPKYV